MDRTDSAPRPDAPWAATIRRYYESYAGNQFILHGNVRDRFILPDGTFGTIADMLETLTRSFDILISYRIDRGLWIERGGNKLGAGALQSSKIGAGHSPDTCIPELALFLRKIIFRDTAPKLKIAVVIHDVDTIAPALQRSLNYDLSHLVSTITSWATDTVYRDHPLATFLLSDTLQDIHPQITRNNRAVQVLVETPSPAYLEKALALWAPKYPKSLGGVDLPALASALRGVTLSRLEMEIALANFDGKPLELARVSEIKKRIIEQEAGELLEFIPPRRTLDDMAGMEPVKKLFATFASMWRTGQTAKFPKGVLASGPVGTGKTFLVECVSGSIGFPVVKLKNFRDKWYGNTEANLERIFRALRALAPCVVFIDEADQALGKRDSGANDGGLSGRIYSAMAQEMSDPATRGKILWFLATSRPDLIEVDLTRPGRVDVKLALMPTGTKAESLALLKNLMRRDALIPDAATEAQIDAMVERLPVWLTPGAAEAICADIYSGLCGNKDTTVIAELTRIFTDYQPPVKTEIMEHQIRLSASTTTRADMLPPEFRQYR